MNEILIKQTVTFAKKRSKTITLVKSIIESEIIVIIQVNTEVFHKADVL